MKYTDTPSGQNLEFHNVTPSSAYIYHMTSKWLRTHPSQYILSSSLAVSSETVLPPPPPIIFPPACFPFGKKIIP